MPLDRLAPDQRAVVQLVLQQGRSYDDLAGLLGIPEDAVRGRAHAGLTTLAPGVPAPASAREISDFLLGQQSVSQREATRSLLSGDDGANAWAHAVADELRDVAGDDLPELPAPARAVSAPAEPVADEPSLDTGAPMETPTESLGRPQPRPRPRPARETPRRRAAADGPRERDRDDAPVASRLGGLLLIAGLAILVAAILIFAIGGDGDDETTAGNNGSGNGDATATATATGTPQPLGAVDLTAVDGQSGQGQMALYLDPSSGGALFAIQARNVPDVTDGNAYAMWLTKDDGDDPRLLGFFGERPRGKRNIIAATGPQEADVTKFAGWLTEYDNIVLSQESVERPAAPTTPVLQGDLPRAEG